MKLHMSHAAASRVSLSREITFCVSKCLGSAAVHTCPLERSSGFCAGYLPQRTAQLCRPVPMCMLRLRLQLSISRRHWPWQLPQTLASWPISGKVRAVTWTAVEDQPTVARNPGRLSCRHVLVLVSTLIRIVTCMVNSGVLQVCISHRLHHAKKDVGG